MSQIQRATQVMAGLIMGALVIWTMLEWLGIHVPIGQ
jgi:hypothetical protein